MDLWHANEEAARRELLFLPSEDVLRRYGSPTEVWSNDKGIHWLYGQGTDPEGGHAAEVWLCFKDGKVTMVGVK